MIHRGVRQPLEFGGHHRVGKDRQFGKRPLEDLRHVPSDPLGDAEHPVRRAELGEAGQSFAQANYGWDALVPQLEKIYRDLRQTAGR